MSVSGPKASSVTKEGEADGWDIESGFFAERDHSGGTRLVVAVPTPYLGAVHGALLDSLEPPVKVLYRQKVDRHNPGTDDSEHRDFVALDMAPGVISAAMATYNGLVYHDARCELWLRGALDEMVVLDADGILYCYPDDPAFRDVCVGYGLVEKDVKTMADRDYVKHHFHAECDAQEESLMAELGLVEVPAQK